MSERTPPTVTVRLAFVKAHPFPLTTETEDRYAEFDRWLAGVKREAAAEALEKAANLTESEAPGEPHAGATFSAHAAWLRDRAATYRRGEGDAS